MRGGAEEGDRAGERTGGEEMARDERGTATATSCEPSAWRGTHGGYSGWQTKENQLHLGNMPD